MPTDLYSTDLKTISGSDLYKAISEFIRVDVPRDDRPREGYLLDFKEELSDRFLHSVAAFANTFGGLLIVGVSEDDGRPDKIVGVATKGELKTQVASVIASNLFPCPPFEIAECGIPNDANQKKLCVIRVRETAEICLLAKKGEKYSIYVRIEDQSPPANASQIRSLLDRKRQSQNLASDLDSRVTDLKDKCWVCNYGRVPLGVRSNTHFRIIFCCHNHPYIPLDFLRESIFATLVSKMNPGVEQLARLGEAKVEHLRGRDWYEARFLDSANDYERRWRLTSRGDVGFVTQVKWPVTSPEGTSGIWTLYDVALDVIRTGTLAKELWRSTSYYGGFRLEADLSVDGLGDVPRFNPLFYSRTGNIPDFSLDSSVIHLRRSTSPPVMETAASELDLDYTSLNDSLPNVVSIVTNQLLRCLGHSADLKSLERSIRTLFFPSFP